MGSEYTLKTRLPVRRFGARAKAFVVLVPGLGVRRFGTCAPLSNWAPDTRGRESSPLTRSKRLSMDGRIPGNRPRKFAASVEIGAPVNG